jgi:hypothetical protein
MTHRTVTKEELIAWRERWKAVEAIEIAELRAKTPAQRWDEMNMLFRFAHEFGLRRSDEPFVEEVAQRWNRLRRALAGSATIIAFPKHLREARAGYFIHGEGRSLVPAVAATARLLQRFGAGVIIGGIAASVLGKPRYTADVDANIVLDLADLPIFLAAAAEEDLHLRYTDGEAFARDHRVVLLVHRLSSVQVDISLGALPFEAEVSARAQILRIGMIDLRLPTPEDLIIFKAVSHRGQDLQDIYNIIQANPGLDRTRIRQWVTQFATLLDMPELWDDIAKWL